MRTMLLSLTEKAWVLLLAGIAVLGFAVYTTHKASGDNAARPLAELSSVSGKVHGVTEITMTTTRKRGGSSSSKHYEIEVTPAKASAVKLHMPITTNRSMLESIIDENIEAKFDPDEGNAVYALTMGEKPLQTYEVTATKRKAAAAASAELFGSPLVFAGSILGILLGIGGMLLRRSLLRAA